MSEAEDRDSKTEEATEKKLRDTLEKGNVPFSREVPTLASLLAILAAASLFAPKAALHIMTMLAAIFAEAGTRHLEASPDAVALLGPGLRHVFWQLAPILCLFMAAGAMGSLVQNPFQFNAERISPKFSRLSPREGLKRLFGAQGAAEFAKSLFKFGAVGCIVAMVVVSEMPDVLSTMIEPEQLMPSVLLGLTVKLLAWVAGTSLVLAAVDAVWSRFFWRRGLRMSKQEVKEEHRQAEGDPMVKHRFKQLARQRASRRMMAKVPKATVVVTNPTHFAVALRYARDEDAAPRVLAKGQDAMALKIRTIAEEYGIAIVENKPLARALYDRAEIDAVIPPEFFRAVAEIIHFLHLKKAAGATPRTRS
jgi:flagellar biosynthesis protein FlhB